MNLFPQRKTLTDLEDNYGYLKEKDGQTDKPEFQL